MKVLMPSKAWTSFWQTVARFDTSNLNPWLAFRNTVGITIPLVYKESVRNVRGRDARNSWSADASTMRDNARG